MRLHRIAGRPVLVCTLAASLLASGLGEAGTTGQNTGPTASAPSEPGAADAAGRSEAKERLRRMLGAGPVKSKRRTAKSLDDPHIVNLRGTHMNVSAVRLTAAGTLERSCDIGLDAALAFVGNGTTRTPVPCLAGSHTP